MKILRDLLALVGLATLVIAGYCYYSACKNPIEVVVIQKKAGSITKEIGKETKKDAESVDKFEENPAHQAEEADGAEAGLTIAGEAA